jgi:hypothetical protein
MASAPPPSSNRSSPLDELFVNVLFETAVLPKAKTAPPPLSELFPVNVLSEIVTHVSCAAALSCHASVNEV